MHKSAAQKVYRFPTPLIQIFPIDVKVSQVYFKYYFSILFCKFYQSSFCVIIRILVQFSLLDQKHCSNKTEGLFFL